jgi:hypothetical protein
LKNRKRCNRIIENDFSLTSKKKNKEKSFISIKKKKKEHILMFFFAGARKKKNPSKYIDDFSRQIGDLSQFESS